MFAFLYHALFSLYLSLSTRFYIRILTPSTTPWRMRIITDLLDSRSRWKILYSGYDQLHKMILYQLLADDPLLKLLVSAPCPWNLVFPWYLNEATNARVIICFSFLMQNKIQISVQINSTLIPCFQSCFQSHPETVRALTAGCSVIRDVWTYPGSATLSGLIIRQMERPWY